MTRLLCFLTVLSSIAWAQSGSSQARSLLAPTGTLRAAFLGDNPALGNVNRQTGEVTGPVADFVKELAAKIGVPFVLIPAAGARDITDRLLANTADMGFMAYNAGRAKEVDFAPAWLMMPNSYIVKQDSPIQKVADADRMGVVIGAVTNDTQDVYLSANLKSATLKRYAAMPEPAQIEKILASGEVAAFAANRQRLVLMADANPKLRVPSDDYFSAGQAVAITKSTDPARLAVLKQVINEILRTTFVRDSIQRAGLKGVNAAQPVP